MRKRQLEMLLEQISDFPAPSAAAEQYKTPAPVAAELLHTAFMRGELKGIVFDLGCGTGILGIGAALLGAERVLGFDSDLSAVRIARQHAAELECDNIDFICCNINHICGRADTVIMNPPFGAQVKGNDRPFLKKAVEISNIIYSIHNKGSCEFLQNYIKPAAITHVKKMSLALPHTFKFHTKKQKVIEVEVYRIENN